MGNLLWISCRLLGMEPQSNRALCTAQKAEVQAWGPWESESISPVGTHIRCLAVGVGSRHLLGGKLALCSQRRLWKNRTHRAE